MRAKRRTGTTRIGSRPSARSLADIDEGEQFEVGYILFDGVRALCEQQGLRRGDRVVCRDVSPTRLVLETERGQILALDRRWASFVEARDPELGLRGYGIA